MGLLDFAVAPAPGLLRAFVPTFLIVLALLAALGWAAYRRHARLRFLRWILPAMALLQIVVFGITALLNYRGAPIAYELDESSLTVRSRTGETTFELRDFESVAPDSELRWHHAYAGRGASCQMRGRRSWGPWGAYGVTKPPDLPWVHLQLTNRSRVVALEGRVNLLASPRDTEAFVLEVRKRLPGASGSSWRSP